MSSVLPRFRIGVWNYARIAYPRIDSALRRALFSVRQDLENSSSADLRRSGLTSNAGKLAAYSARIRPTTPVNAITEASAIDRLAAFLIRPPGHYRHYARRGRCPTCRCGPDRAGAP